MVNKSVGIWVVLFGSSSLWANISVEHNKPDYIVSGHRIKLEANIKSDESPIDVVRTYFKSLDGRNFVFVDMDCKEEICTAILPAIKKETKGINYIFLIKDEKGKVVKTQAFEVKQKKGDVPKWQNIDAVGKIIVKSELKTPPEELDGFDDNIVIDAVSTATKYGMSVGISSSSSAGTTGTSIAKISATGITDGGTVTATTTAATTTTVATTTTAATTATVAGVSTTTVVAGGAVAAAAVAGVAVAATNDDSDEHVITEDSTIEDLKGSWSVSDPQRTAEEWHMTTNIGDEGSCSYTECAFDSCTDGSCSVTLEQGVFSFHSDGDANFGGDILGKSNDFSLDGNFANGDTGQICWTK